jgi:hypothetical protein
VYNFHSQAASFVPWIEEMKKRRDARANGDVFCRDDFWQHNNSSSLLVSFNNTKSTLGHWSYILKNKKKAFEKG